MQGWLIFFIIFKYNKVEIFNNVFRSMKNIINVKYNKIIELGISSFISSDGASKPKSSELESAINILIVVMLSITRIKS
uniref:Uncharacterized protein n=1 Tax=Heterorhabditis bacteriophora TaxID=37862 RepID=A0A1I7WFL5_HETBA